MGVENVGGGGSGDRAQGSGAIPCVQNNVPQAWAEAQPAAGTEGVRGLKLVGVRAKVARMQADAAPPGPSLASSATSAEVSSPSSPESPETVRREGPRVTGRQRGEGAAAGMGEGGDRGGQAEASGGRAEEVAAGAEGQREGQGQRAAVGPRANPFNIADVMAGLDMGGREWRESVVADILEVSEDEGKGAGRMAVEGGPGQLSAPSVPAAAMKSILPEVRRQKKGKGGRGQPEAGAAGRGVSSVRAGGRGRTSKGRKGQAGTSGAVQAKGHQAGKGGKGS